MQITIDTASLMGDETTIRDEVIEIVAQNLTKVMEETARERILLNLEKSIKDLVERTVLDIVSLQVDTPYEITDSYGRKSETTTIRENIAKKLEEECTFKKKSFSSDQSVFTTVVQKTVEDEMKKFQKEYMSVVNRQLVNECLDEATKKLKAAIGLK